MCEANAYMLLDGKEELVMEGAAVMKPMEDGRLYLMGLSGEQRYIAAKALWVRLLEHKIILEKV